MQTFLPDPDFAISASYLDYRRLGKQRLEALQIYKVVTGQSEGWKHHPAVKMWMGYPEALATYHNVMISEWKRRGYSNTMRYLPIGSINGSDVVVPPWVGYEPFHASHRAALLAKDPGWYKQWEWTETPAIAYVWPSPTGIYPVTEAQ